VLAAVVVPLVSELGGKADGASTIEDLGAIRSAVGAYVAVNRRLPRSLTDLTPFASQLALTDTGPTGTYTSKGYGLKLANALVDSTIGGTHYVVAAIKGATHGSCDQIDSAIDNGTGGRIGNFGYDATADAVGSACGTTANSHVAFVLVPGTPGQ
jgi:hypothetical protein